MYGPTQILAWLMGRRLHRHCEARQGSVAIPRVPLGTVATVWRSKGIFVPNFAILCAFA